MTHTRRIMAAADFCQGLAHLMSARPGTVEFHIHYSQGKTWAPLGAYRAVDVPAIAEDDGRQYYFIPNQLKHRAGRSAADLSRSKDNLYLTRIRFLFIDADDPKVPLKTDWPIMPTVCYESSPGKFYYGWVITGVDAARDESRGDTMAAQYEHVMKQLASKVAGGDPKVSDFSRLIRLPGTWHRKGTPWRVPLVAELCSWEEVEWDAFLDAFDITPALHADKQISGPRGNGIRGPNLAEGEPLPYGLQPAPGTVNSAGYWPVICPLAEHGTPDEGAGYNPDLNGTGEHFHCFKCEGKTIRDVAALKLDWAALSSHARVRRVVDCALPPELGGLPDVVYTTKGKYAATQELTTANYEWLADLLKCEVRYNLLAKEPRLYMDGVPETFQQLRAMAGACHMKWRQDDPNRFPVSRTRNVHPVWKDFEGKKWDGADRLTFLVDLMGSAPEGRHGSVDPSRFVRHAVGMWLAQTVWAARSDVCRTVSAVYTGLDGDAFKVEDKHLVLDSVLTFTGGEGIGKSTFFSELFGKHWGDKAFASARPELRSFNYESIANEALKHWVCELAEINDLTCDVRISGKLKRFLSTSYDKWRGAYQAYVHGDPRTTVFCGTTNELRFLQDESSLRRTAVLEPTFPDFSAFDAFVKGLGKAGVIQLLLQCYETFAPSFAWDRAFLDESMRRNRADYMLEDHFTLHANDLTDAVSDDPADPLWQINVVAVAANLAGTASAKVAESKMRTLMEQSGRWGRLRRLDGRAVANPYHKRGVKPMVWYKRMTPEDAKTLLGLVPSPDVNTGNVTALKDAVIRKPRGDK